MGPFISPRVPLSTGLHQPERSRVCKRSSRYSTTVLLSLFVCLFILPQGIFAQPTAKRILIVTGYNPGHPAVTTILQSVTGSIRAGLNQPVEFFYEFQETLRIPNA